MIFENKKQPLSNEFRTYAVQNIFQDLVFSQKPLFPNYSYFHCPMYLLDLNNSGYFNSKKIFNLFSITFLTLKQPFS